MSNYCGSASSSTGCRFSPITNPTELTVDAAIAQIKQALPEPLRETAYAFACEIIAADRHASQEELQLLEVLSYDFEIDPLAAAAIQRGARAQHMKLC